MLECLFDETGNVAVAQSYSATSLYRRKIRALSGSFVLSMRCDFGIALRSVCASAERRHGSAVGWPGRYCAEVEYVSWPKQESARCWFGVGLENLPRLVA